MKQKHAIGFVSGRIRTIVKYLTIVAIVVYLVLGPQLPIDNDRSNGGSIAKLGLFPAARATSAYADLSLANLSFNITPSTPNQITSNDDWSGVPSVEGYFGLNLTATHGVDPQTVLGTEFAGNALPVVGQTQVNANKGNPSAFNAGGVTEFDTGTYISIGLQGNVQANPYIVFYVNTLNRSSISIAYEVTDIDAGSNNSVSPVALQYRVGQSGLFTNVPAAFIQDASDGPNLSGRVTTRSVLLPAAVNNQSQVQIRLITTNAAGPGGSSTPDEWIGVNNMVVSSLGPSAAHASVDGRVMSASGRPVSRAVVSMTDNQGRVMTSVTNPFGYFCFTEAVAGSTYVVEVTSKQYKFDSRVVVVLDDLHGLDFIALE
jgi:hypothetical protein